MRRITLLLAVLVLSVLAFAQPRTRTGTVRDEKGDPIPFATITEVGKSNATKADANGVFTIKVANGTQLRITATGHQDQTVTVTGDNVNVTLATRQEQMSEVVVTTALGIRRQAKELGYAATTINSKTITQGRSVNVQQALNGKISGVDITTTNSSVFENAKINIRGIRSLTGNNQPLLIVDGAPVPLSFLYDIPPADIQDLTVLKSAASAAIYGPDAVNGVIVVTTKKGTGNKLNVTVSSTVQLARVAYFPKLQKRFGAGAGETFDIYGNYGYVPYENQMYGPEFDGSIKPIGPQLEDGSQQMGPYTNEHYNDKVKFWNTGATFQNAVSISGQDFYFSVDDAHIKGLMPKDENRRTSFRFNSGKKVGNFSVNYGLNYVLQNYNVVNEAGIAGLFPRTYGGSIFFQVLQTPSNVPLLDYKDWQNNKFAQYSNYYNGYAINPYWGIDNARTKGRSDDIIGNIDLSYQFFSWLRANARVSGSLAFSNFKNNVAPIFVSEWAKHNRDGVQYGADRPGNVFDDQASSNRINFEYFLNGDHNFTDFSLRYTVGGLIRQNRAKEVGVGGNNLAIPYLYNVSARSGEASVPGGNNFEQQSRLYSVYGSVGLGYKDWAFLELTGRNDWDSRLLPENRSFFYPGANASILLSEVWPTLKNSNVISYAKIRGAYAKSGNVNLGVYALNPTYSQPAGFPFGSVTGYTANNTIPSPDLKPEFVINKEVGLELGFLRNRINLEGTYFYQNCDNQILAVTQSATTGYPTALANAASFKNSGVEADLSLTPLVKVGKGSINFKFNATYNDNQVLSTLGDIPVLVGGSGQFIQNAGSSPTANNIAVVGGPAFAFQLTDYERDPSTGKVIVNSTTGMPKLASNQVVLGRSLPLWILGFTPSYSIGSFSASMTWDYKGGHDFYAQIGSDEDFAGISARSAEYGRKRFVFPNSVYMDASGKYVPNTSIQVQDGNAGFWSVSNTNTAIATNYFASAAAWRLREVNLSYSLPMRWFGGGAKVIKSVTVSAVGKNLLLFVPKSNQWGDPEFNSATGTNTFGLGSVFGAPTGRLFGGSLAVQF